MCFLAGGSGGHIFPALAVASKIRQKEKSVEIRFLCSRNALDRRIFTENGEDFTPLFSGKIRRYFSLKNFIDPIFLVFGFFQSLVFFLRWHPDVIFSKGGFSAVPPVIAAALLRIPIVAHETDAASGLANRLSARFAQKTLSAWSGIGNPVREAIFHGNPKNIPHFKNPDLPLIFGFFGSQGAQSVNELFFEIAEQIPANIIWAVGIGKLPDRKFSKNIRLLEFVGSEFPDFLAAADLVISRSGGSIFEIAAAQKPSILIPLSSAANNHQWHNAEKIKEKNAAEIFDESGATPKDFLVKIKDILENSEKRKILLKNIALFSSKNAAEKIAEEILKIAKKS